MNIDEIKESLISDKINYSEAFELIKKLPQIWTRKEWIDNRSKKLKDSCFKCKSKKDLLIQHDKQPTRFSVLYNAELDKLTKNIKVEDSEIYENLFLNSENRQCCPTCKRTVQRTTKESNFCTKGHSFKNPILMTYYTKSKTTDIVRAKESAKAMILFAKISKIKKQKDLFIGKAALLNAMKESEIYMSMVDTKTYCKSCAFKEDFYNGLIR